MEEIQVVGDEREGEKKEEGERRRKERGRGEET